MNLANMQPQKVFRWEIPSALRTPVRMHLRVVYLELFEGRELKRLGVGRQRAFHYCWCGDFL